MSSRLALHRNTDGSYDLIVIYDTVTDVEFGSDHPIRQRIGSGYTSTVDRIKEITTGIKMNKVKIMVGGLVLAVMPYTMFLKTYAASDRYSMSYLYFGSAAQQIEEVHRTYSGLDVIAPSLFDISGQGQLVFHPPAAGMVESYQDLGLQVVPYLSNHWDQKGGILALEDPEALAREVAELIVDNGLDGVNVDIENVTPAQKGAYVELVRHLRELVPEGKEVSVAVAANPNGYTTGWHGSYDYASLAQHADYLMLMTYDEHYQGGEPGPVASVRFVERSIEYALEYAQPEQIVVGLPFYGRIWSQDGFFQGHGVPLHQVEEMVELYGAQVSWDSVSQSPKAVFTVEEDEPVIAIYGRDLRPGQYEVWYENDRSILAKLDLVDKYSLKGTGSWALGQQTDQVWSAYQSWIDGYDYIPEEELPEEELPGEELPGQEAGGNSTGPSTGSGSKPSTGSGGARPSGGGGGSGGGGSFGGGGLTVSATSAITPAPVTPASTLKRTGQLKVQSVLRSGPGDNTAAVATLASGNGFVFEKRTGDWYRVTTVDGKSGYLPIGDAGIHSVGVSTIRANLYSTAVADSANVTQKVPAGTAVTILEYPSDGWRRVRLADGTEGFMRGRYVANSPYRQEIQIRTTTSALNLRDAPSKDAHSHGTIPAGEKVLLLGTEEGYDKISYGSHTAYVSKGYLE